MKFNPKVCRNISQKPSPSAISVSLCFSLFQISLTFWSPVILIRNLISKYFSRGQDTILLWLCGIGYRQLRHSFLLMCCDTWLYPKWISDLLRYLCFPLLCQCFRVELGPIIFIFHDSKRWIKKELSEIYVKACSACIFLKSSIVFILLLRSLICLEFIFLYVSEYSNFIPLFIY